MILQAIRKHNPLIHCITNYVVANFKANGLLAIGASPVMADEVNEVEEMVTLASALVLNIGTLNNRTKKAMLLAGKKANALCIPVVLDPVGVGATAYRKEAILAILNEVKVDVIRCNIGELAAIANVDWQQKGVDSGRGEISLSAEAKKIALRYKCTVIVTGEQDLITDGEQLNWIKGGNEKMTEITGTGCLLSAICAAAYVSGDAPFTQLIDVLKSYKKIAENAITSSNAIGDFQIAVLNELHHLSTREVN
ncbi:MAG: hydroxyethylthiazole kinase [Lysinibacillus sp.]